MPLIHSAGAGLSLAAAGSTALLGVSAMVAFNGWPGMRASAPPTPVQLADTPAPLRAAGDADLGGARPRVVRLRAVPATRPAAATHQRASRRSVSSESSVTPLSAAAPRAGKTSATEPQPAATSVPTKRAASTLPDELINATLREAAPRLQGVVDPVTSGADDVVDSADSAVTDALAGTP